MRKLASIQKILEINPIENADHIEAATILGWHVVVRKGEFEEGDLVVYVEVDSILPKDNPYFDFLEGKRLKTKKLRGVYSQGIAFPLFVLPSWYKSKGDMSEGADVTEVLGIQKWEPDEDNIEKLISVQKPKKWYMKYAIGRWFWKKFLYKPSFGPFPSWIHKTDETRIQVMQDILDKFAGTQCEYTEKVDGSSITVWYDQKKDKLHVCSRNREIYDKKDKFFVAAKKYEENIQKIPGIILQGELLGPGIQGNKYRLNDYRILFFQAINEDGGYLNPSLFRHLVVNAGLETVPYLGTIKLGTDIDYFVSLSKGMSILDQSIKREGIVIRPETNIILPEDSRFVDGRLSIKVINPEFLIKYDL